MFGEKTQADPVWLAEMEAMFQQVRTDSLLLTLPVLVAAGLVLGSGGYVHTVSIGLALFRGIQGVQWNHLMAASTVVKLPTMLLFFFFQRIFIQGTVITGVKG
jgi:ABC-type glycerol-3-phosphate transport system permease component